MGALSAKWTNNDAIDKVCLIYPCYWCYEFSGDSLSNIEIEPTISTDLRHWGRYMCHTTQALTDAVGGDPRVIEGYVIKKLIPFNPIDKQTSAHLITPGGEHLIVVKGAPQVCTVQESCLVSCWEGVISQTDYWRNLQDGMCEGEGAAHSHSIYFLLIYEEWWEDKWMLLYNPFIRNLICGGNSDDTPIWGSGHIGIHPSKWSIQLYTCKGSVMP